MDEMRVACPQCGTSYRLKATPPAGARVKCPKCAAAIAVGAGSGRSATSPQRAARRSPDAVKPGSAVWLPDEESPPPGRRVAGNGVLWAALGVAIVSVMACIALATALVMRRPEAAEGVAVASGESARVERAEPPLPRGADGDAAEGAAVAPPAATQAATPAANGAAAGPTPTMTPTTATAAAPPARSTALATPPAFKPGAPRYLWEKGEIYVYNFKVLSELADETETVTGTTVLRASPWRDEPQPNAAAAPEEPEDDGPDWAGTAFVVHSDGYLATCAHVAEGADALTVHLNGGAYPATVVSTDDANDVALLRINVRGLNPLPLADANRVELGAAVRVLGFPYSHVLGDSLKVSQGIVSGVVDDGDGQRFQIDAPLNHGNSGGPVLSDRGEVVGVASSGITGSDVEGLGFAAPAETVLALMTAEKLTRAGGAATAPLGGPALVARAAKSVAFVEARGQRTPKAVISPPIRFVSNAMTQRTQKAAVDGFGRPMGPGFGRSMGSGFAPPLFAAGTLRADSFGEIHELSNDMQASTGMAYIGLVIETLDPDGRDAWSESETVDVSRPSRTPRPWESMFPAAIPGSAPYGPQYPRGFGPGGGQFGGRPFGGGYGPRPTFGPYGAADEIQVREPMTVHVERDYRIVARHPKDNTVVVEKTTSMISDADAGGLDATAEGSGQFTFDLARGCVTRMDFKQTISVTVDNVTVRIPVTSSYALATPAEYVRAELPRAVVEARRTFDAALADQADAGLSAEDRVDDLLASIRRQVREDHNPFVELNALEQLPVVPSRQAVVCKLLLALAADGDGNTPSRALDALGKWADASCVPALIKLLEGGDDWARDKAAEVLGELHDARAAEPLAKLLATQDFGMTYERALIALGPAAEGAVLPLLANADEDVRRSACDVLEEIGTRASIGPINKLLDAEGGRFSLLQSSAQRALEEIRSREAGRRVRNELDALVAIEPLGSEAPGDGAPGSDAGGEGTALDRAVEVLSARGASDRELRVALDRLNDMLPPDEATRKRVAALVAAHIGPGTGMTARRAALTALGKWGGPEHEDVLLELLAANDPTTRPALYEALARTRSRVVGRALLAELDKHGDNGAWAPAIADAIASTGAGVQPELMLRLSSNNVAERAMAARALAGIPGNDVDAALEQQLKAERTTNVALEEAVKALARRRAAE